MFWTRTGSQDLSKTAEFSSSYSGANEHQNDYLLRRHALNEPHNRGIEDGQRHIDFSLATLGLYHKSKKIFTFSNLKFGIPRPRVRINANDSNLTRNKCNKIDFRVLILISILKATLLEVTSLTGTLCLTPQVILHTVLQMRYLQLQQTQALKFNPSCQSTIYHNQDSIWDLQSQFNNQKISNGNTILTSTSKTIEQRDTFKKDQGGYFQKVLVASRWTPQDSKLHINILQLKPIELALLIFSNMFQLQSVHFQVDHLTVLSYLKQVKEIHTHKKNGSKICNFSISKEFTQLLQNIFWGV